MMNGIPPSAHQSFAMQGNPQVMAARQQQMQNMRQLQPGVLPPATLPYQQMQHPMHPQMQMQQQLQAAQQANPGMRINPQHQVIQGQHLMQQQGIPGPMQHMGGQQVSQQLSPRYVYV
jgi:hypothetical protein